MIEKFDTSHPRRALCFCACVLALLSASTLASPMLLSPAVAGSPLALDPSRVAWSRLLFRASDAMASVTIEVRLATVPSSGLEALPDAGADGAIMPPDGAEVSLMTAAIVVDGYDKTFRNEVWFLPGDAVPLQRRRDKIGKDANRKTFRYAADGVYRVRLDPEGRREAELPPEQWSARKTHFYPYETALSGCPVLTDPALLLFVVSAGAVSEDGEPLELCVFNKKTVYRVRARAAGARPLEVAYTEIGQGVRNEIERGIDAQRIRIVARPGDAAGLEPDPFEFFEITGDIEIVLDPSTRVPVMISGDLPGLGRVDFSLSEVTLAR